MDNVDGVIAKNETKAASKKSIAGDQAVPREEAKKKKKLVAEPAPVAEESAKAKKNTDANTEQKSKSSSKATPVAEKEENDGEVPMLMPKQHKPMKKSALMKNRTEELIESEHYQLPPKDEKENTQEDDDEYRPPLPPKQRYQNETSRALVYDFIGSELQELRATLAQFDKNSSSK